MQGIFSTKKSVPVADGTLVASFLNCLDSTSGLPPDLLTDFSIAVGLIEPGVRSKIHLMPLVNQVTFVLSGSLEVLMKDQTSTNPYTLQLDSEQAILTQAGTFVQFHNCTDEFCKVLYIVSPAYVLELAPDGTLRYDDAIVFDESWEELAALNWQSEALIRLTLDSRKQSIERLLSQ